MFQRLCNSIMVVPGGISSRHREVRASVPGIKTCLGPYYERIKKLASEMQRAHDAAVSFKPLDDLIFGNLETLLKTGALPLEARYRAQNAEIGTIVIDVTRWQYLTIDPFTPNNVRGGNETWIGVQIGRRRTSVPTG